MNAAEFVLEVEKKKIALEDKIRMALQSFTDETGVVVGGVSFEFNRSSGDSDHSVRKGYVSVGADLSSPF